MAVGLSAHHAVQHKLEVLRMSGIANEEQATVTAGCAVRLFDEVDSEKKKNKTLEYWWED